ncbi:MAG: molybdenum ABC transporter ATP-binding protein [Stellaceae bacterium]
MLNVSITHRLGAFTLDAEFASEGGLTALFGRSGAGKTSLVNAIAGLIRPDRGHVAIDGEVLTDTATGRFVPAHRRRVGYVFQEGRLFPHLNVRQNLAYGRWFAPKMGISGSDFDQVVGLLGIAHLLARRPANLSGGEKQRVAIGRALLARPRVLVMDEPLASLDDSRRHEIFPYIERLRDEMRVPIVYVSHSVPEVARLATTLVVLSDGQVAAIGPTAEIMGRLDLFPLTGRAEAGAILATRVAGHDHFGLTILTAAAGELRVPRLDLPVGTALRVRIRARDVMIALAPPENLSALNVVPGTVAEIAAGDGPIVQMRLDCAGEALIARLTRRSVETMGLIPGLKVHAVIKSIAFDHHAFAGAAPGAVSSDAEIADS